MKNIFTRSWLKGQDDKQAVIALVPLNTESLDVNRADIAFVKSNTESLTVMHNFLHRILSITLGLDSGSQFKFVLWLIASCAISLVQAQPHKKLFSTQSSIPEKYIPHYTVNECSSLEHLMHETLQELRAKLSQPRTKPPLVIFDIDDTALTIVKDKKKNFSHQPIKPVLNLYKEFTKLGCKIAFVTWRTDTPARRLQTMQQLRACGYNIFEALHMKPPTWENSRPCYKEHARTLLAKHFDIIATLDDRIDNFEGNHTGDFLVWIPRPCC